MKNLQLSDSSIYGFDIFWLLRILAQLPPIEFELPIPGSEESLVIVLDLNIKAQKV